MSETLTRQELYDLVWSEPITKLAARFQLSDVGLRKQIQAAHIPLPERGFWAKLAAGKAPPRTPLAPRSVGQSDRVQLGSRRPYGWYSRQDDDLTSPIPPPTFDQPLEEMEARLRRAIGKVAPSRSFAEANPQIKRALELDAARKDQPWTSPPFFNASRQATSPAAQ